MAEPGYLGKVMIGDVEVGGMFNWNYGGETRASEDIIAFGQEVIHDEPTLIKGGELQLSGNVKIGDDGIALLIAAFSLGTKYLADEIQFFINEDEYFTPDATSSIFVSKIKAINHDASGIAKIEATFKVDGQLEELTET